MPKLMALLTCEKVIVDLNSKTPSVISIFQTMNVPIAANVPLPEKALAPIAWAVFSVWQHDESERGVEYTQRTEIIDPSGTQFANVATKFKITEPGDFQSKNTVAIFGLPVSAEGVMIVRVWLEGVEGSTAEYPFQIKHVRSQRNEQSESGQQQPVN
jgi:hypothetical protein